MVIVVVDEKCNTPGEVIGVMQKGRMRVYEIRVGESSTSGADQTSASSREGSWTYVRVKRKAIVGRGFYTLYCIPTP